MSTFILKTIALITMILDHTGHVFGRAINIAVFKAYPDAPILFTSWGLRVIGRIAFPIYAYLIATGCRNTKDMKKYLLRLFMFGLISEIPMDLAVANASLPPVIGQMPVFFDLSYQNVYFTLFLGALAIYIHQLIDARSSISHVAKLFFATVCALLLSFTAKYILFTDYGAIGVFFIYILYIVQSKKLQLIALSIMVFVLYFFSASLLLSGFVSVALIAAHNGKKGPSFQTAFYWAYPIHLSLLAYLWLVSIRFSVYGV